MIAGLMERLRALLFPRRWSSDLDEEMREHLGRETARRIREGLDPEAARREAALAFGGVEKWKEAARDESGARLMGDVSADLRFAVRSLGRNPGFTAAAVGVLAVAIGASTAAFTVVNAVLLRALPYEHPERLVRLFEQNSPTNRWNISTADVQGIRERQRSFDAWGGVSVTEAALSGEGAPEQIVMTRIGAGVFDALGVSAEAGRAVTTADEPAGAPPVVLLSHALATRRFGSPLAALGRSVALDGVTRSVVGVLPTGALDLGGRPAEAWIPLQLAPATRRGPFWMGGIGRLKPGVDLAAARRDLAAVSEGMSGLYADWHDNTARLTPYPLRQTIVGSAEGRLDLFAGAVLLVLLVAIANVATLMLVRASARRPEIAMRITLGATRIRLARLVIAESTVLMAVTVLIAAPLAALGLRFLGSVAPGLPRSAEISLGWESWLFLAAVALSSGALVSLSPVAAVLSSPGRSGMTDTRRAGTTRRAQAVRGTLVAAEFALALPLLLGASLLLNSFLRLTRVDPGFDPSTSLGITIALPSGRYGEVPARQEFFRRALAQARQVPGVLAAGLATEMPPDAGGNDNNFNLVDHPVPAGQSEPTSPWSYVSDGYFEALSIPLVEGRFFTPMDSSAGPPVAVVSLSWQAKYFPGEHALGHELIEGGCYTCPHTTIVGVVGDVKFQGLAGGGDGVYVPLSQSGARTVHLFVKTAAAPAGFVKPMTDALHGLDPDLPLAGEAMSDHLKDALADPGRWTAVLIAFGAAALVLAVMGVFGLLSYVVRQQRREIGVRLALGADPGRVARMVVWRGMRTAGIGIAAGLLLSVMETKWLGSLLYDVTAHDPLTVAVATLVLLAAAVVACLLPGLKAARIRPIEAIAAE
ncbi:MAG TPA: ADOP family duplicated permease [Gemmatimonadales bacterium]